MAELSAQVPVLIVGAGPAGLTAASELVKRDVACTVWECSNAVGGLARTEVYKGYRFDIGGHRFYTKIPAVQQLWNEMLGPDFREVPRLSRIYHNDRFFKYPLDPLNALSNLGPLEGLLILSSYVRAQLQPHRDEQTFEQWVSNRFGRRLYRKFFQTYTEKVWGIPCHVIRADWAAQRIQNLSLKSAVSNALFGTNHVASLISSFHYPVGGPGMMWERFRQSVDAGGGRVQLNTEVVRLRHDGSRITSVAGRCGDEVTDLPVAHVLSSMPLPDLIARLDPAAPTAVLQAAAGLKHRALIVVGLIISQPDVFRDNWIYVHTPAVKVGRIQNFKNWSSAMVPDPQRTSLGLEYFCNEGDSLWQQSDGALVDLATRELGELRLLDPHAVEDGVVFRQAHAYPVYDEGYRERVEILRRFLGTFTNLQTLGRNGMHRYNNQDHSMLTAILAVRNLLGERHDLWEVNTERSYYEDFTTATARDAVAV